MNRRSRISATGLYCLSLVITEASLYGGPKFPVARGSVPLAHHWKAVFVHYDYYSPAIFGAHIGERFEVDYRKGHVREFVFQTAVQILSIVECKRFVSEADMQGRKDARVRGIT